jgi:HSP20 family protein
MTIIRRTNPLGELVSLRQAMDRLFEDSFVRPRTAMTGEEHQLALDIRTTGDELVVEAALPGVKPEDVDVTVLGDTLTISAAHQAEQSREDEGYTYREIRRGSFSRTITLPAGVKSDAASATFENGMLTLRFPKAEEAKPRQIRITSGEGAASQSEQQPQTIEHQPSAEQPSNGDNRPYVEQGA